jgi:hypothetical protein
MYPASAQIFLSRGSSPLELSTIPRNPALSLRFAAVTNVFNISP